MMQKKCFRIILTALTILIFAENVYSENCPELNFPVGDRVQITKKEKREIPSMKILKLLLKMLSLAVFFLLMTALLIYMAKLLQREKRQALIQIP